MQNMCWVTASGSRWKHLHRWSARVCGRQAASPQSGARRLHACRIKLFPGRIHCARVAAVMAGFGARFSREAAAGGVARVGRGFLQRSPGAAGPHLGRMRWLRWLGRARDDVRSSLRLVRPSREQRHASSRRQRHAPSRNSAGRGARSSGRRPAPPTGQRAPAHDSGQRKDGRKLAVARRPPVAQ